MSVNGVELGDHLVAYALFKVVCLTPKIFPIKEKERHVIMLGIKEWSIGEFIYFDGEEPPRNSYQMVLSFGF